ncbi:hypothetical protein G6F50_018583 [Rhizopus delemar]|uniref:Uncharacterized protein n=1 Tax=Rhizopus delemar TaxID=936053 RepID=A0A9P6XLN8_9FUNG|nr:hypothetical protein G6F50_018583 [Rhizopus delemar]
MRAQCFQHPAIGYAPARAIADHPLQFALQRRQVADPARDVGDMRLHHVVHRAAFVFALFTKGDQLADLLDGNAQLTGSAHE